MHMPFSVLYYLNNINPYAVNNIELLYYIYTNFGISLSLLTMSIDIRKTNYTYIIYKINNRIKENNNKIFNINNNMNQKSTSSGKQYKFLQ